MSVEKITTATVSGLATQPNPLSQVAPGTLSVADNCVARRKGVLSPMPANVANVTINTIPAGVPVRTMPGADGSITCVTKLAADANGNQLVTTPLDGTFTSYGSVAQGTTTRAFSFRPEETHGTVFRNRQIITEYNSPVVLPSVAPLAPRMAGLPPPAGLGLLAIGPVAADEVWTFSDTKWFAYRAIFLRVATDSSYELKSAPTASFTIKNTTGGNARGQVIAFWQPGIDPVLAGDYIVLYRTEAADSVDALGDNFQEVLRFQLTSTQITAGFVTLDDYTHDQSLGNNLYTNANEEGAIAANLMPPPSTDVCTYGDMAFYASKGSHPIVSLSVVGVFGILPGFLGRLKTNAIGTRTFSGTATIGSRDITGVALADTYGLAPFQAAVTSSGAFPFRDLISTITGAGPYTVRMSTPSVVTGPVTVTVCDTIQLQAWKDGVSATDFIYLDGKWETVALQLAAVTNVKGIRLGLGGIYDTTNTGSLPYGADFFLYSPISGLWDRFSVFLSNGTAYSPSTPSTLGRTQVDSIQDTRRNRLWYSKTGEPEHCKQLGYIDVGAGQILKMWASESALFVFCTDGLWKVTGIEDQLTIQQLDKTTNLVHPDCVCGMDNQVWAWITDGLAAVGENGAETVSTEAVGPALKAQLETYRALVGSASYWGPSIGCDNYRKEVWLNCDYSGAGTHTFYKSYILNTENKVFTTQTASQFRTVCYASWLNAMCSTINNVLYLPATTDWVAPTFQFNPPTMGDAGTLKQWVDANYLIDDISTALTSYTVTPIFDGVAGPARTLDATATAKDMHVWVPRRSALNKKLSFGFTVQAGVNFNLYGFALRARVASDSLKR